MIAPPNIGTTKFLLSGWDAVGQARIRTNPNPAPNFSTFRSTPGGGYARMNYGGYGGYGRNQSYQWGYPVSYSWPWYWAAQYPYYSGNYWWPSAYNSGYPPYYYPYYSF